MTPSPSRPSAPADSEAVRRLADRCGVPFTDLTDVRIDRDLVQSFPPEFLYRANVIPLGDDGANLRVAVADPSDLETIDAIRTLSGRNVVVEAAPPRAIQEALRKSETALQVLKGATEGFIQQLVEKEGGEEEEVISLEKLADQDGSIIKLVNTIIFTAVQKRPPTSISNPRTTMSTSSTGSTASWARPWSRSTRNSRRRSSPGSRSCPTWTSPSAASPRTAGSG